MVWVRSPSAEACYDATDLADAGIDAHQEFVDVAGKAIEVDVAIILVDAAAEIAGSGCGNDERHAGLQVVALGAHRRFLGIHAAYGIAVLLEYIDGGGHLADFVCASGKGNLNIEVAFSHLFDRRRHLADRSAQMRGTDIDAESGAGADTDHHDAEHDP